MIFNIPRQLGLEVQSKCVEAIAEDGAPRIDCPKRRTPAHTLEQSDARVYDWV